jgi:nuclease HARBI1
VTPAVLEHLVEWIGPELSRRNNRGLPLSPRQRIQVFLHFLGTNSFYHEIAGSHVSTRSTVRFIVREVCEVLFSHRNEVIKWPENPERLAAEFYRLGKIPCVAGIIDGTHVPVQPPSADEASFVNRKQGHSINCLVVSGKHNSYYYFIVYPVVT